MLCAICRASRQAHHTRTLPSILPPRSMTVLRRPQTAQQTTTTTVLPTGPRFYAKSSPRTPQPAPPAPAQPQEQPSMSPAEESIAERLRRELRPTELLVRDVSGGCGSMYAIDIASPAFRGISMLKQQRMVNAALGELMREWHGLQLNTRVSQ
ncbi:hypothetical protein E4U54_004714 [Claviceps lovelessii]|nr:hypothetical protein E4U54_004714 [Claviceps lovelessii]